MGKIEKSLAERCGKDTKYYRYHCRKTCKEYREARAALAAVGASCEKDYQCGTNMCYNKKCVTGESNAEGNCRYHASAYGHCEKRGEDKCTKKRTILKTNHIVHAASCMVKDSVQDLSCDCGTERLANGAICEKSRQCASEVCHSKTKKCVESTRVGNCMYHFGETGKCQRIHRGSTHTCEMHRKIEAAGSYNEQKSNEEGGCYTAGQNSPAPCNCDTQRIQEGSPCTTGSYCASDVCKDKSCAPSFKHEGCAFSFGPWKKCKPDAKNKNICKQRRNVDKYGFITKRQCNSRSVSDKLEQACACPATPSPTTSTTKNECTEHTDAVSGKKYYYNKSTKKTAWKKADCLTTPATATSTPKSECTEHADPTGKKYYYNTSAKKTAWKKADCLNLK